jgi:hypothetical protein
LSIVTGAIGVPSGHPAAYDILIGLHVVCVVIGFGAVALSGIYGAIGRDLGRPPVRSETVQDLRRFFSSDSKLGWLLVAGPAFGATAMAVRPGGSEFEDLWVIVGEILWVVATVVLLAGVRPSERRIQSAVRQDAGRMGDPSIAAACRRLMWAAAASDVIFVIALFLMVTQPR